MCDAQGGLVVATPIAMAYAMPTGGGAAADRHGSRARAATWSSSLGRGSCTGADGGGDVPGERGAPRMDVDGTTVGEEMVG